MFAGNTMISGIYEALICCHKICLFFTDMSVVTIYDVVVLHINDFYFQRSTLNTLSQPAFTCSKSAMELLKQRVKSVQS